MPKGAIQQNYFSKSGGYRSCIAYYGENLLIAVGSQSCDFADLSDFESTKFEKMAGKFFTVKVNKYGSAKAAWASGPSGTIGKLNFNLNQ